MELDTSEIDAPKLRSTRYLEDAPYELMASCALHLECDDRPLDMWAMLAFEADIMALISPTDEIIVFRAD